MCDRLTLMYLLTPSVVWVIFILRTCSCLGFRGRTKPNLLRQETSSILTALRLLYRMMADQSRADDYTTIHGKLLRYNIQLQSLHYTINAPLLLLHASVVLNALEYFLTLTSDNHRDSWTTVLLLMFTRLMQVSDDEV